MTGWILLAALGAAVGLLLWRFGGLRGPALQFYAAALLLAMAGYAWQGRPGLDGSPAASIPKQRGVESGFALMRDRFLPRFDAAARWLILADSYQRRGDTEGAVQAIRAGLRQNPRNMSLWMGLGNALALHGGAMNAAAELAYRRAIALAPEHPAPRFFYGMSLIEAGRPADGERVWANLLAGAPAGASWRPFVAERLALLRQLMAMQQERGGGGAAPR